MNEVDKSRIVISFFTHNEIDEVYHTDITGNASGPGDLNRYELGCNGFYRKILNADESTREGDIREFPF